MSFMILMIILVSQQQTAGWLDAKDYMGFVCSRDHAAEVQRIVADARFNHLRSVLDKIQQVAPLPNVTYQLSEARDMQDLTMADAQKDFAVVQWLRTQRLSADCTHLLAKAERVCEWLGFSSSQSS
eukprot:TRINITY_DN152_c0_g2_i1.p1 TRINITY_DN152_c0_g2~~TRINITY_DN152_c0_g2_i1.p1  ORF type:complete len:126 (+),score=17.78 TRINITY_DN152_c0_g2_i1:165-542(+)